MSGIKSFINKWVLRKALGHLGKGRVVYKSSLHNHFQEDGVKTIGRFNVMLSLLLVIESKTNRFLGIRDIELDEDSELLTVRIKLNKVTHIVLHKEEIEEELGSIIKKQVKLELKHTNKLFGIDYYSVI